MVSQVSVSSCSWVYLIYCRPSSVKAPITRSELFKGLRWSCQMKAFRVSSSETLILTSTSWSGRRSKVCTVSRCGRGGVYFRLVTFCTCLCWQPCQQSLWCLLCQCTAMHSLILLFADAKLSLSLCIYVNFEIPLCWLVHFCPFSISLNCSFTYLFQIVLSLIPVAVAQKYNTKNKEMPFDFSDLGCTPPWLWPGQYLTHNCSHFLLDNWMQIEADWFWFILFNADWFLEMPESDTSWSVPPLSPGHPFVWPKTLQSKNLKI